MGGVALAASGVEVVKLLPGASGMGIEVIVATVGDSFEFVPSPWEKELNIRGAR